jgi:hypothetical protein
MKVTELRKRSVFMELLDSDPHSEFGTMSSSKSQIHDRTEEKKVSTDLMQPEIIDPVFAKTSPKRSFSITEYERFGLGFTKTRVYKFGHSSLIIFLE